MALELDGSNVYILGNADAAFEWLDQAIEMNDVGSLPEQLGVIEFKITLP